MGPLAALSGTANAIAMKLVLATPLYPPEIGGPATYAKILEEGLPSYGIEVELVKFSAVRHLPKVLRHYAYYRRVLAAARGADAVFALDPASTGVPAMYAARKAGKPLMVKIVGDYAWEQGRQRFGVSQTLDEFVKSPQSSFFVRALQKAQASVASSAARVIVPSVYLKRVVAAWGISSEKIEVIYNAVPTESLGSAPGAVDELPRPLIATMGRLVPWKGVEGVIDAVASLPGAGLAIIGDGPERAALARRAREKLPGRHAFLGALRHPDALAVVAKADAFVLNSSYEGLSHALIEALALGAPTIATAVGGNTEIVEDGDNGLLVRAGDTAALSSTLARLLADAPRRARLSARARESAKRFAPPRMLDSTAAFLEANVGHSMSYMKP